MKRVVFAWTTVWLDFDTKEELEQYKVDNQYKKWIIKDLDENDDNYTLVVQRPYGNYNTGW